MIKLLKLFEEITKDPKSPKRKSVWVLNRKYCLNCDMEHDLAIVQYTREPIGTESPFSLDAIKNIPFKSQAEYIKEYTEEREAVTECDGVDSRRDAAWEFYKMVKTGDIILFAYSNEIEGYFTVTGAAAEHKEEEDACLHGWEAKAKKFKSPLVVNVNHVVLSTPFFKRLDPKCYGPLFSAICNAMRK